MTNTTERWPSHWDAQRIAEFKAAMARVHHREPGTLSLGTINHEPIQGPLAPPLREAPPVWRKRLPSDECLAFIAEGELAHAQWVALRASLQRDAA